MDELLLFIENKKRNRDTISSTTVQCIKSAVKKYRERNGFADFSEEEVNLFKRYVRGISKQTSQRVRDGELSGDEGKRHLKREEYEFLSKFCLERYNEVCSQKFGTELLLFLVLG